MPFAIIIVALFIYTIGPAEQERKHLCQAIAVMVAAVLGSPARSSPLWYYIFAADELMKSYAMDYDCMVSFQLYCPPE